MIVFHLSVKAAMQSKKLCSSSSSRTRVTGDDGEHPHQYCSPSISTTCETCGSSALSHSLSGPCCKCYDRFYQWRVRAE